jgi:hypothetical protein
MMATHKESKPISLEDKLSILWDVDRHIRDLHLLGEKI